ncbi:hypothetical protein IU485_27635 [Nocardia cyriacigeorgica]|uniref:hypothetical protein n=1 Tax=Nocardia cyriacigeorgica TaxID=135487 RepID=UPI001893BD87|nr:hypothetical protein [Nocardia cyriacigeorgica]MBF6085149.1 hypothetical protein [Nocardia cyriacigeorgica]
MIRSIALWLFGRPAIELLWTGASQTPSQETSSDDGADGISYACARCDEILIDDLAKPLDPKDAADLLAIHDCPARRDP